MEKTTVAWNKVKTVKWAINIILPALILLIPINEAFTHDILLFMALTIFLIALIATDNIPVPAVALLMPVAYIVIMKVPPGTAFGAWAQPVPWLVFGAFIISFALEKTGLIRRIALRCIITIGCNYGGIIYGMLLSGTILSLVISDPSAKAVLLGSLALSICKILKLELGGKVASGIGLSALIAMLNPGMFFMHGSTNIIFPMGITAGLGLAQPSWLAFLIHMFVPQLIFTLLCMLVIQFMYKPGHALVGSRERLRQELKDLGSMSLAEKKLAVISGLLIIAVVTSSLHGIAIAWLFIIAAILLLWPGIMVVEHKEVAQCNIPFIVFIASCLSIGLVSSHFGVGKYLGETLTPMIAGSLRQTYGGVWVFGFISNFLLTPLAAYSAFTEPVVRIAESLSINAMPLVYTFAVSLEQVVFAYEFIPVLMLFGFGMISFKNMVIFNIIKSVLCFLCILLVYTTWWSIIGIL